MIKTNLKNTLQKILKNCGYEGRKFYNGYRDIGRQYEDLPGILPHFTLKIAPPTPWSGNDTLFIIDNGKSVHEEIVYYSHLTLLKMCKHYTFDSVIDIGSHEGRCTRIFKHLGKKVTSIEIAPGYETDINGDYLNYKLDHKVDAIWCSQVYEHQRNPGIFLDKIFDDLNEGGILALTVPFQMDHWVYLGHLNLTSPLMLIYHLISAGFDCSEIALRCYAGSIGVILKKKYNGIKRGLAFGSLPLLPTTKKEIQEKLGDELFSNMIESFPKQLKKEALTNVLKYPIVSLNWDDPI